MNIIGIPTTGNTTAKHNVIQRSLAGLSPYTMAKWMSLVFGFHAQMTSSLPLYLYLCFSVSLFAVCFRFGVMVMVCWQLQLNSTATVCSVLIQCWVLRVEELNAIMYVSVEVCYLLFAACSLATATGCNCATATAQPATVQRAGQRATSNEQREVWCGSKSVEKSFENLKIPKNWQKARK